MQTDHATVTAAAGDDLLAERKSALTSRLFQVLADPTRIRIVGLLLEREHNVSELVARLDIQQGRVSTHLACLKWCGFVTTRRQGKYVYYSITDPRVRELVTLAQRLLADHAGEVASCLRIPPTHAW